MRAFKVFIFGLLYGWVFKTAFDRIYRENELEDIHNENAALRDYIRTLEDRLTPMSLETRAMPQAEMASVETVAPTPTTFEKDNLKLIKGIGPAIEKKLNNAGIQTFAALAQLNRQDLENILGSQINRLQDENDLIKQAKKLSRQQGNLP